MRRPLTVLIASGLLAFMALAPEAMAQYVQTQSPTVDAAQHLGTDYMQSPYHRVAPRAMVDGSMLHYIIETPYEPMVVIGTEQTKTRIQEIHATEALRQRSTGGAVLGSAKDRATNLVETPYRVGKTLVNRAGDISNVGDAVLFVPEQVGQAAGSLLNGVGELGVTAVRITKGAAGTKCSGFNCVEKAGTDIWSGVNSLVGKHNASRRLHDEFGTDPETQNRAYRQQINRLAYSNAYTGTAIKLGAGQAGIDYISPAFTGVGYYNNAEFVGQYEDAHRQRNFEKKALISWGADPRAVDNFYRNKAFTKQYRRRLFRALNVIPDKVFAVRLFHDTADIAQRYKAETQVVTYEYIADLTVRGEIAHYHSQSPQAFLTAYNGTNILPIYADYLQWSPHLEARLMTLASYNGPSALHILGRAGPSVKQGARQLGIHILEWPVRVRP